jgi:uncharacterized membrane protein YGL010W
MISIEAAVSIVITLIVLGLVFGLLLFLVNYCAAQFPTMQPFAGVARVVLMILAVLVLIGLILNFAGHPVFRQ